MGEVSPFRHRVNGRSGDPENFGYLTDGKQVLRRPRYIGLLLAFANRCYRRTIPSRSLRIRGS
jgi:hypothetical protein